MQFEWLIFDGKKLKIKKGTPLLRVNRVFEIENISELEFIASWASDLKKDPPILSFGKLDKVVFLHKNEWYSFGTDLRSWDYKAILDELKSISNDDLSTIEKQSNFTIENEEK